ncbi:hypothetical protein BGW39_011250 [Mortierella sp. 14UC]|nr:hypothetical protein BGW39_011250 [Mortierella sp. 14UC]
MLDTHYPPLGSSPKTQNQQHRHQQGHHGHSVKACWDDDDDDEDWSAPGDAQQEGYTGPDGYFRLPGHQHHSLQHHRQQQNQQDWRDVRKANKAPTSYTPRQRKGRRGRGDMYMDDYHAGYNKVEIQAMSSERKAAFEAQKLKRESTAAVVSA